MKKKIWYFLLVIELLAANVSRGQQDTATRTHSIAIFVPLYLDSVFDPTGNYRYDKSFPKFLNQGLEFYEGAQLALDSLQNEGAHLDVHIYDTRSAHKTIAEIIKGDEFQPTELIIGHVSNSDLRQLAEAALHKNIPFINANFPNDGGISNNPDFVLLNSTLKTHFGALYKFLQKYYPTSHITVFRKKGSMEERIKNIFTDIEKNTASVPLKLNYVTLNDQFAYGQLVPYLDSTTQNILISGSLDENFAKTLCGQLAIVDKTYPITLIGMPNWDNLFDFSDPGYEGMEILYSTPFYLNPTDNLVKSIQKYFKDKFYSRPSDMVFRGFETTYHFGKLLLEHGTSLSSNIGEKKFKVFDDFDIEPVFLNKQNMTLDYFENKKLYIIKKVDGNVTAVFNP
jgi:hypothetical protein